MLRSLLTVDKVEDLEIVEDQDKRKDLDKVKNCVMVEGVEKVANNTVPRYIEKMMLQQDEKSTAASATAIKKAKV